MIALNLSAIVRNSWEKIDLIIQSERLVVTNAL